MNRISLLVALSIVISSCGLKVPFVYRIDIQQGNVIEQSMINKLDPGMTKSKVQFIMGTPLLIDPFHSDRWEYFYSIEPGGGQRAQRHVSLFFKDDKLTHLEGNITQGSNHDDEDKPEVSSIIITGEKKEKGLFSGWFRRD